MLKEKSHAQHEMVVTPTGKMLLAGPPAQTEPRSCASEARAVVGQAKVAELVFPVVKMRGVHVISGGSLSTRVMVLETVAERPFESVTVHTSVDVPMTTVRGTVSEPAAVMEATRTPFSEQMLTVGLMATGAAALETTRCPGVKIVSEAVSVVEAASV